MLNTLKGPLTAAMISSLALVPAATVAYMATADIAIAKSDKAGGNGKGNGGQKSSSASKGKSGTKSASSGGGGSKSRGHGGLDKLFGKITGKKTVVKTQRAASKVAKGSNGSKKTLAEGEMHASSLGKMNGPLHANVNALIAHVKNGNTNGPIGGMAALAVAGYAAADAENVVGLYEQFAELDQLLIDGGYTDVDGNPDLQAYLDALEPVPGNDPNDTIEAVLARPDDYVPAEGDLTLEETLLAEGFGSLGEYEDWRDGTPGADPIPGADTLITDLEGQDRPSDEEIEFAEDRIEDRNAAEDYMLSIWNKGDGDDTMRSPEEEQLLTKLYERIEADGVALSDTIEEYADLPEPPAPDEGEELTECAAEDAECAPEEEIAAVE